ncbi:MAG: hypothetical protein HY288_10800 [Planctomycetia bacterium]|nr:hypothetical protein [Planctomycetia bacterium]
MELQPATTKKSPSCPRCGNRLRLLPDQIGTTIMCPKCNATFIVGRPQPASSTADLEAYEPEMPLKQSSIVPEDELRDARPEPAQSPQYDTDWSTEGNLEAEPHHVRPPSAEPDYLAVAKAKGLLRNTEPDSRPPRWTFFSGVFLFPWQGPNLSRWAVMAVGLALAGAVAIAALDLLGLLSGHVGTDAVMGIPLVLLAVALLLTSLAYSAACFLSAVQDTADGFDLVQEETLPELGQWIFTLGGIFLLWSSAAAIGYPLTFIEGIGPLGVVVCNVVFFPILLLSAMESDSFFAPYSPAVLRTLVRLWLGWLLFYLITTPLTLAWLLLTGLGLAEAPYVTSFVSGPALAAIMLIYARLLGRVAWKASGMPASRRKKRDDGGFQPGQGKKKRRKIRIAFPEDLDAAARQLAVEPPSSAGRINSPHRSA